MESVTKVMPLVYPFLLNTLYNCSLQQLNLLLSTTTQIAPSPGGITCSCKSCNFDRCSHGFMISLNTLSCFQYKRSSMTSISWAIWCPIRYYSTPICAMTSSSVQPATNMSKAPFMAGSRESSVQQFPQYQNTPSVGNVLSTQVR